MKEKGAEMSRREQERREKAGKKRKSGKSKAERGMEEKKGLGCPAGSKGERK